MPTQPLKTPCPARQPAQPASLPVRTHLRAGANCGTDYKNCIRKENQRTCTAALLACLNNSQTS
jgi:hypothetical protein